MTSSASSRETEPVPSFAAKQRRSRVTYDRLVGTGLKLARDRDLDAIPVAEIAKQAGYSVGAFYARFRTKEEFHRALVRRYCADATRELEQLFASTPDDALVELFFERQIDRISIHHRFWRASLHRSFENSDFWEPFRATVRLIGDGFVGRAARRIGRALTEEEERTVRFAIQVTNGAINNTMINRPGPVSLEDSDFLPRLMEIFRSISKWDELA